MILQRKRFVIDDEELENRRENRSKFRWCDELEQHFGLGLVQNLED
jgi:hypothetical protein